MIVLLLALFTHSPDDRREVYVYVEDAENHQLIWKFCLDGEGQWWQEAVEPEVLGVKDTLWRPLRVKRDPETVKKLAGPQVVGYLSQKAFYEVTTFNGTDHAVRPRGVAGHMPFGKFHPRKGQWIIDIRRVNLMQP